MIDEHAARGPFGNIVLYKPFISIQLWWTYGWDKILDDAFSKKSFRKSIDSILQSTSYEERSISW